MRWRDRRGRRRQGVGDHEPARRLRQDDVQEARRPDHAHRFGARRPRSQGCDHDDDRLPARRGDGRRRPAASRPAALHRFDRRWRPGRRRRFGRWLRRWWFLRRWLLRRQRRIVGRRDRRVVDLIEQRRIDQQFDLVGRIVDLVFDRRLQCRYQQ
ncbi:hypothetical protein FPZ24_09240 [Sphingomonas panacisoli]|uniref:Uncharacterized protein n=1 Tax=Sphingomonas panacisoli TaxID=1813879 RepID=A0A5B8LJ82_9SPHN|nr:hypothetical protein FPZ24_09240 [Sphingomonas panacisoli]